jgi:transposase InsO family protein
LNILDEYTRECLNITVERNTTAYEVIHQLGDLFIRRGIPEHIRSDNGPEFTARAIRSWLEDLGVRFAYIEPGSPLENGYIKLSNDKLRDELLDCEIFMTLFEAKVLIEQWRREYNNIRPHSSLDYKAPGTRGDCTRLPTSG